MLGLYNLLIICLIIVFYQFNHLVAIFVNKLTYLLTYFLKYIYITSSWWKTSQFGQFDSQTNRGLH